MASIKFSAEELEEIKRAVKDAESETAGEIATAFIKESDNYAVYELMFALFCGFIYFVIISIFADAIEPALRDMFWDYTPQYLLSFYGFSTFLVIGFFYLLANLPFVDRLVVPKGVMARKVNERAQRHFLESGIYNTKDRTGILIFISGLERRVELMVDKGISEKISQQKWNHLLDNIVVGIKEGKMVQNLCDSIRECGKLLAEHYPIQPDDVNELKDDIAILEK